MDAVPRDVPCPAPHLTSAVDSCRKLLEALSVVEHSFRFFVTADSEQNCSFVKACGPVVTLRMSVSMPSAASAVCIQTSRRFVKLL